MGLGGRVRSSAKRGTGFAILVAGALAVWPAAGRAQVDRAEPLEVPRGAAFVPEAAPQLSPLERVERGAAELRDRGNMELPVLAWALLYDASGPGASERVERALELAPSFAGVRFSAARALRSPSEAIGALVAVSESYPALLWLATLGGAAAGVGLLFAAAAVLIVVFARTVTLHGHGIGHVLAGRDPPAWPGGLLLVSVLALLPLVGLGPVTVLAAAGAIAALRAPRSSSIAVALVLVALGLGLGPGADYWGRLVATQIGDAQGRIVWRIERGQPLPGDRQELASALARRPDDLLLRLGLASLAKREGDMPAAQSLLADVPETGTRALHAQAANLRGIVHLALGEVPEAISAFRDALAMRQSAAVLYNLSQAYARGMRLLERTAPFRAARDLDPELIATYTSFSGNNVHRYLIEDRPPLSAYFARALTARPAADVITADVRARAFGRAAPEWLWMVLPLLGVFALMLRRQSIRRCSRCERPLCTRCSGGRGGNSCVRCAKLFSKNAGSDPRVRKMHLELDRQRQRRLALARAAVAVVLPGGARVLEGRPFLAIFALFIAGFGAAFALLRLELLPPFDVGELGSWLPLVGGTLLLALAYGWAFLDVRRELRLAGRSG